MKHLLKKLSMMGGGGKKPKPQPATLKPPQIGDLSMAASYSYAEMLDLISDGPIEGLVNQNGLVLKGKDVLQGIYLDDTAVAVSNDLIVESKSRFESGGLTNKSMTKTFNQFFTNLKNLSLTNFSAPVGFSTINNTKAFTLRNNGSSRTLKLSDISVSLKKYILSTNLTRNKQALINNNNFVNYFDLSLNLNVKHSYSTNQKTSGYFKNQFVPQLDVIKQLVALFNRSGTNKYEKAYLSRMFSRNFGEEWEKKKTNELIRVFANSKLDATDIIYVIRPSRADKIPSNQSLINNAGNIVRRQFVLENASGANFEEESAVTVYDFILPRIDKKGNTTGAMLGCLIVRIKTNTSVLRTQLSRSTQYKISYSLPTSALNSLASSAVLTLKRVATVPAGVNEQKFNYTNILAEYRSGEEYQNPFKFFKNILIDKNYGSDLLGPFVIRGQVQKIKENANMLLRRSANFNIVPTSVSTEEGSVREGSVDSSRIEPKNFSDWNRSASIFNEVSSPIKHVIYNPNVRSVFVTIQITSLSDTLSKDIKEVKKAGPDQKTAPLGAGSKFPSVVNIEIETGLINEKGEESDSDRVIRKFQIVALIESPTLIDIGNPDVSSFSGSDYDFISQIGGSKRNVFTPFPLRNVENPNSSALDSPSKRYVKITKLSTETNSVLINKDISLVKVTEIIPLDFSYPHSAIVATKIDSRSFGNIPTRTFDCKLKKVRIPSNYFPSLKNGKDKRYYSKVADFDSTPSLDKRVYVGDWDGTLSKELQWTDNPAWILYDLLTNQRYGLGQYIDPDNDIDIFDLYKIGRFCDAVDDNGFFEGVPDNAGGLEPRFSCNIMFNEGIKVFDALNTIASLFRGLIYYNNSQINFVDDRPRTPIALFANTNVKDGIFNYTNYRRDEQFNSIEVVYIDRLDNFLTKVEYVEDEDDIRKRGIFKKTINANGVTSRAMARRLGQHLIFQTIKENQSVSFTAGLESLLCKPGDLIIIEDELKSLKSNFGKVLSVNPEAGSIRLNEQFFRGQFDNRLTVYTPTGYSTPEEIKQLGKSVRTRLDLGEFTLTRGGLGSKYQQHTGLYRFSGYTDGFKKTNNANRRSQYAFYTGANNRFCYYSTQFTGWVLAINAPFTNKNSNDKFIFNTLDHDFDQINRGSGFVYQASNPSGRGDVFKASNNVDGSNSTFRDINGAELGMTQGLLDSDISLTTSPQITAFDVAEITNFEYGCEVAIDKKDINYSLIPFVAEGSLYRFQRKLADDQVYKVISIQEESPNEYSLICTKFDTEKYALIENDKSIVNSSNTVSYSLNQKIGDTTYKTLRPPKIARLTTGENAQGFFIRGRWTPVKNAEGYNVRLYQPNGDVQEKTLVGKDSTGLRFFTEGIGNYSYQVSASGNYQNSSKRADLFFDSEYSVSGLFLVYSDELSPTKDRPFLSSVTIL
jgi:hypothetical protein